jgi:hypothetical protein
MLVHEHSAKVKVLLARTPAQVPLPEPVVTLTCGPPPVHMPGPPVTDPAVGTQAPFTQPVCMPPGVGTHLLPHPLQLLLSV